MHIQFTSKTLYSRVFRKYYQAFYVTRKINCEISRGEKILSNTEYCFKLIVFGSDAVSHFG